MEKTIPCNISYSSFSTFKNCKLKFFREYIKRIRQDGDSFMAVIGTLVQAIFENVNNKRLYKTLTIGEIFDEIEAELPLAVNALTYQLGEESPKDIPEFKYFEGVAPESVDFVKNPRSKIVKGSYIYRRCLDRYLRGLVIKDLDRVVCEQTFKKQFKTSSGVLWNLKGSIDFLITNYDNTVSILDGKRNYTRFNSDDQLMFYILGIGKKFKSTAFWNFTKDTIHKRVIANDDIVYLFKEINEMVEVVYNTLENGDEWEPNPTGDGCTFCALKGSDTCKPQNTGL